jgi:hypothetical protein
VAQMGVGQISVVGVETCDGVMAHMGVGHMDVVSGTTDWCRKKTIRNNSQVRIKKKIIEKEKEKKRWITEN